MNLKVNRKFDIQSNRYFYWLTTFETLMGKSPVASFLGATKRYLLAVDPYSFSSFGLAILLLFTSKG